MSLKRKLDAVDSNDKRLAKVVKHRLCDRTETAKEDLQAIGGFTGASGSDKGTNLVKKGEGPELSQLHIPKNDAAKHVAQDGKLAICTFLRYVLAAQG